MKLIFNARVVDKNNGRQYEVGEVVEFDDKRGAEILRSSFASELEAPKTPKKTTTRKKKEE